MIDASQVAELAASFTPIEDIAVLLDVPEMELRTELADRNSEVARAYRRAKAEAGLKIRQRDISLADAGSPTAADAVRSHYISMEDD